VSEHQTNSPDEANGPGSAEKLELNGAGAQLQTILMVVGIIGLLVTVGMGMIKGDGFKQFFFAYLAAYVFVLAIALGGLFFVLIQFVTNAGWSVSVRRIAEWIAMSLPVMGLLAIPIIVSVLKDDGALYPWARPQPVQTAVAATAPSATTQPAAMGVATAAGTPAATVGAGLKPLNPFKQTYLNPSFFIARLVIYFVCWWLIASWFWGNSVKQDTVGDFEITRKMQFYSKPLMIVFAMTLTFASFDLLMSLDPGWDSTIFGVYYFAGSTISAFAMLILISVFLQSKGYLTKSITIEHYHDLGKFLFAFTIFWGYIAYSQYMLQWYANLPEETRWFQDRGATTATGVGGGWALVVVALLFGHLLIPFCGLMSRHVKRFPAALAFWAAWQLFFVWVDMVWLVRPDYSPGKIVEGHYVSGVFDFGLIDITAVIGIGAIFLAMVVRRAGMAALRPLRDPRLTDALAFQNI
jgi:hypothetical protein